MRGPAPVLPQQPEHLDVVDARGLAQRRQIGSIDRGRIGAVLEQEPQRRRGADDAARDLEGGALIVRSRVHVGAGVEQELHLRQVGRGPHQGGGARGVGDVGIRARGQQLFHDRGVAVQRGGHQWRRSRRPSQGRGARGRSEQIVDRGPVAFANQRHEPRRVGIRRRHARLTGHLVRPFSALVDPLPDDFDLLVAERSARRHLRADAVVDQAVIEAAAVGVSGPDVRLRAAAHRIRAAVEAQAVHLHLRTVAADAVIAEDRLDVAREVDARRRPRSRRYRCRADKEKAKKSHGRPLGHGRPVYATSDACLLTQTVQTEWMMP